MNVALNIEIAELPSSDVSDGNGQSMTISTVDALSEVWMRVLELDRIRPDDNFFLLGGDSLRAAALFAVALLRHRILCRSHHLARADSQWQYSLSLRARAG